MGLRDRIRIRRNRQVKSVDVPVAVDAETAEFNKALTTAARIAENTRRGVHSAASEAEGLQTDVDYKLLRQVARKSEVIDAILRRTVDDTLGNGYEFILADNLTKGDPGQYQKLIDFFKQPNSDDSGDEWLEAIIYDLQLFGDAYIELDGAQDYEVDSNEWDFDGDLQGIWSIAADSMRIIPEYPTGKLPEPPEMAYIQVVGDVVRKYSKSKVIHISKLRTTRAYGTSPLISLLKVVGAHLNLSDYIGRLFSGMLPKTLVNVGDISTSEMSAMLALIEQQVSGGQSPYGLITVNGGTGFNIHKLIDSPSEGQFLDQLYYYREEICAVFGIPPMKLGWVQTGKLANPESQLDAWYDVIDSFHRKLESVINGRILPMLEITDWQFNFKTIRPSRDAERAEVFSKNAEAVRKLRQEGTISVNEARAMMNLESIDSPQADDPFFVSPVLNINQPNSAPVPSEPVQSTEQDDGDEEPTLPPLTVNDEVDSQKFIEHASKAIGSDNWHERKERMQTRHEGRLLREFEANQNDMFRTIIKRIRPAMTKSFNSSASVTKTVSEQDMTDAINAINEEIQFSLQKQSITARGLTTAGYEESLNFVGDDFGIGLALNADDLAAINYFNNVWTMPAVARTLGVHRAAAEAVIRQAFAEGRNWKWTEANMRNSISAQGANYPRYYYERIARTETRRIVENSHLSAYAKMGFSQFKRFVTIDETTDKDLCEPFEDYVYDASEARGLLPAHPNCRCSLAPLVEPPKEGDPSIVYDEVLG